MYENTGPNRKGHILCECTECGYREQVRRKQVKHGLRWCKQCGGLLREIKEAHIRKHDEEPWVNL